MLQDQAIKFIFLFVLIGFGVGLEGYAQQVQIQLQPLKINIQLPAGVGLSSGNPASSSSSNGNGTTSGKESGSEKGKDTNGKNTKSDKGKESFEEGGQEPIKGSTMLSEDQVEFALISETGKLLPLSWIRMQSMENSQFLVEFKDLGGSSLTTSCYFLNNNTDELQDASKISVFPALLQFNEKGRLIRNFSPRRTSVYSWIGIPNDPGLVTVIEYF
jgi:hypothetical protein